MKKRSGTKVRSLTRSADFTADFLAWPKGREEISVQWVEFALRYGRHDIVARFLRQVPTDRCHRGGLHMIAELFHAPTKATSPKTPKKKLRPKTERIPQEQIGKYILDQKSAGLQTTTAVALAVQEFGIKKRTAYYALQRARELQLPDWRRRFSDLVRENGELLGQTSAAEGASLQHTKPPIRDHEQSR